MFLIKRVRVRQEAFSLVEVMVAMGIASVIAVSTSGLVTQLGRHLSIASSKSQFSVLVSKIQSYLNNPSVCLAVFQTINIPHNSFPTSGTGKISINLTPFGATPSIPNVFDLTTTGGPTVDPFGNSVAGIQKGTVLNINSFNLISITYLSPNVYQTTLQLFAQNYQGSNLIGPVFSQVFSAILSYDSSNKLVACNASTGVTNQPGYSNIPTPTGFGQFPGGSGSTGLGTGSTDLTLAVYGNVAVQSSATQQPGNFTMYGAQTSSGGGVFTITSAAPPSSSKIGSNESSWIQEATADGATASSTVINASSVTAEKITGTSLAINSNGRISTGGPISGGSLTVTGVVTAASLVATTISGNSLTVTGDISGAALAVTGAMTASSMTSTGNIAGASLSIGTAASNTIVGGALNIGVTGAALSSAPVYIGAGNSTIRFDTNILYQPATFPTQTLTPSPYPSVTTTPAHYAQAAWSANNVDCTQFSWSSSSSSPCWKMMKEGGNYSYNWASYDNNILVNSVLCFTSNSLEDYSSSTPSIINDTIVGGSVSTQNLNSSGKYCVSGLCVTPDTSPNAIIAMCTSFQSMQQKGGSYLPFGSSPSSTLIDLVPGSPVVTAPDPATTMVSQSWIFTPQAFNTEVSVTNCENYTVSGDSGAGNCPTSGDKFSIEATGAIIATSFYANSDERFKTEIVDYGNNLSVIEALSVKSYRYRDFHEKGDKKKIGFIAQEVQKVLPQAVQRAAGMLPSIYALATQLSYQAQDKELFITLEKPHLLKKDNQVKFIDDDNKEKVCAVHRVLSAQQFSVQNCWDQKPEQLFVWGKAVDDVLTLNYETVFSVGIGAIQELKKEKDAEIQALRRTVLELKAAQDIEMEFFQKTVFELEKELAFIKKIKLTN